MSHTHRRRVLKIIELLAFVLIGVCVLKSELHFLFRYIATLGSVMFIALHNHHQGMEDGMELGNAVMNGLIKEGAITVNKERLEEIAEKQK